eukprot:9366830-Ditylum_brightwellii.AAC.1
MEVVKAVKAAQAAVEITTVETVGQKLQCKRWWKQAEVAAAETVVAKAVAAEMVKVEMVVTATATVTTLLFTFLALQHKNMTTIHSISFDEQCKLQQC